MREIKFRAWDDNANEMYYEMDDEPFIISMDCGKLVIGVDNGDDDYYEMEHIMQYTGLKDKNGKEIYERDIVDIGYGRGKVVFNVGCFMLEWIDDPEANMELLGIADKYGRVRDQIEIIGNIYENPELLKP